MSIHVRVTKVIVDWWQGEYVDLEPPFVMGYYRRHWTARAVSALGRFYITHWQWLWTTTIAVLALLFSVHLSK